MSLPKGPEDPAVPSPGPVIGSSWRRDLQPKLRSFLEAEPKMPGVFSKRMLPDDGHQWHKYGHKTLVDNTFSRAYYRCAQRSSGCPVKKTVDFPVEGSSELRITYDGQHNHGPTSILFQPAAVVVRHKGKERVRSTDGGHSTEQSATSGLAAAPVVPTLVAQGQHPGLPLAVGPTGGLTPSSSLGFSAHAPALQPVGAGVPTTVASGSEEQHTGPLGGAFAAPQEPALHQIARAGPEEEPGAQCVEGASASNASQPTTTTQGQADGGASGQSSSQPYPTLLFNSQESKPSDPGLWGTTKSVDYRGSSDTELALPNAKRAHTSQGSTRVENPHPRATPPLPLPLPLHRPTLPPPQGYSFLLPPPRLSSPPAFHLPLPFSPLLPPQAYPASQPHLPPAALQNQQQLVSPPGLPSRAHALAQQPPFMPPGRENLAGPHSGPPPHELSHPLLVLPPPLPDSQHSRDGNHPWQAMPLSGPAPFQPFHGEGTLASSVSTLSPASGGDLKLSNAACCVETSTYPGETASESRGSPTKPSLQWDTQQKGTTPGEDTTLARETKGRARVRSNLKRLDLELHL